MAENFKVNRARKECARTSKYKRKGMPRVLIVPEGAVSEVCYFNDLCRSYNITLIKVDKPSEGVCIAGNCDSAPINVFDYAKEKFLEKRAEDRKKTKKKEKSKANSLFIGMKYIAFLIEIHIAHTTMQ